MISFILTICILSVSAVTDLFYRKVYNCFTFPAMLIGILLCGFPFSFESYFRLFWMILFFFIGSFGIMGMGDLKLIMAVIALRGIEEATTMFIMGTFLLLGYCFITRKNETIQMLKDTAFSISTHSPILKRTNLSYPFATFLSAGYFLSLLIRYLQ